jgi:hypothetical protein
MPASDSRMRNTLKDDLRDIIRLLACTGARVAEISGLEEDIDLTINIRFQCDTEIEEQSIGSDCPCHGREGLSKHCGSG